MKALFIYYTGTYNTLYLCNKLKRNLSNFFDVIDIISVFDMEENFNTARYDFVFLAYPIYAFNTVKIYYKKLKKIEFSKENKIIIVKQSGEPHYLNNSSSNEIKRLIKRKTGNKIQGEYHFLLPYNIHFRYEDKFIRSLINYDNKLIEILKSNLEAGRERKIKTNALISLNHEIFKIQRLGATINSFFYKVDNSKCSGCLKCLKMCPVKNIYESKDKKIHFKHHCLMCMRCSFYCPKNAIKIGLLDGWRVNGSYNLDSFNFDYVFDDNYDFSNLKHKKFYSVFIKYFLRVDYFYEKTCKNK